MTNAFTGSVEYHVVTKYTVASQNRYSITKNQVVYIASHFKLALYSYVSSVIYLLS